MKTGIVFDLDGTLLNTLEDLLDATNYALTTCGYPERTLPELRRFVGNGARNQIRLSLPEGARDGEIDRVLGIYKPYYIASRLHGSFQRLIFVGEDIRVLKNRGI